MIRFVDMSDCDESSTTPAHDDATKTGKFVQISSPDGEYIVFAPAKMCKYHSDIVARFADSKTLDVETNGRGEPTNFVDRAWRILGGGKALIDKAQKTATLGGSSQAFGPFVRKGLAKRLESLAPFHGFSIRVEAD